MILHKNTKIVLALLFVFLFSFLVWNSHRSQTNTLEVNVHEIILKDNQTINSPEIREKVGILSEFNSSDFAESVNYSRDNFPQDVFINKTDIIAFATNDNITISQAVGRAKYYIIFQNCSKTKLLKNEFIFQNSSQHMSDFIPQFLERNDVKLIIGGHFGSRMADSLNENKINFSTQNGVIKDFMVELCS